MKILLLRLFTFCLNVSILYSMLTLKQVHTRLARTLPVLALKSTHTLLHKIVLIFVLLLKKNKQSMSPPTVNYFESHDVHSSHCEIVNGSGVRLVYAP